MIILDKVVVGALREATDRKSIENIFNRFDIKTIKDKTSYLVEAMHNPQLFFSNGENATLQHLSSKHFPISYLLTWIL